MTKRRVEPLLWLGFSGGGVLAAVFLPVLLFLFGLAFPLGWITPPSRDHLVAVASNPITLLFLLALVSMSLTHAAHRLRFALQHGFNLGRVKTLISPPLAGIRSRPVEEAPDAAMIESSSPQVAPRLGPSSRATSTGGPRVIATFFRVAPPGPGSKKPIHRPSGDVNGPLGRPGAVSGCGLS